jgi:hypothetical protein
MNRREWGEEDTEAAELKNIFSRKGSNGRQIARPHLGDHPS